MRKINFNAAWEFALDSSIDEYSSLGFDKYSDATGAAARYYDFNNWQKIDLPHDWALSLSRDLSANTFAGAYPNTHYHRFTAERRSNAPKIDHVGWYRKQFPFDAAWTGKRVFIVFEGVFRDAAVFVNGVYLDRHTSGYTSFALELTDHLAEGEDNSVAVRVDSDEPEGWWYEGAGIYRNVYLLIGEPVYFKYNQTVIRTALSGAVDAAAVLVNDTDRPVKKSVTWRILDKAGHTVAERRCRVSLPAFGEREIKAALEIASPSLWHVDSPYLYTLQITAGKEEASTRFGVRTVAFDADRGFLLNGKPLKIRGACVHQDFGGVGVALPDNLQYYKIKR